jgi:P-type E1-E2 ATPase
MIGIYV